MIKNIWILLISLSFIGLYQCESIDLLMPNVSPQTKDSYLCVAKELTENDPKFITQFVPHSHKEVAHHILVYACEVPGVVSESGVWNCGEMSHDRQIDDFKSGPICRGDQSIIYAWAMDAPQLDLPKDVGFRIGEGTNKKFLVMQVHYANVDLFANGETDNSGIVLNGQNEELSHLAGVYFLATAGFVRKNSIEHFEAACEIRDNIEMIPFAYRAHTHKLGVVNSGYLVQNDPIVGDKEQTWTEIGRRSPQLPQMFYPVSNNMTIKQGDIIASRCTIHNTKDHTVQIGATGDDEMCNFYIMYYTSGKNLVKNPVCFTNGPPNWYFEDFRDSNNNKLELTRLPSDISKVPNDQINMLKTHSHNHHTDESKVHEMEMNEEPKIDEKMFYIYLKELLHSKHSK